MTSPCVMKMSHVGNIRLAKTTRKESCSVINISRQERKFARGNTCLHALEEINGVPYREFKVRV